MAVFTGTSLGSLSPVSGGCNFATVATQEALVDLNATAGTTYLIQVGSMGLGQNLVVNFSVRP